MYYFNHEITLAKDISNFIEIELNKVGLLYRIFYRAKTECSLSKKINSKGDGYYTSNGKKIQDFFGIRVVLYFLDDLSVAQDAICGKFSFVSKEVDPVTKDSFSAQRCNFIFRLPDDISRESQIISSNPLVDNTFEVQFRTILSEGWHEVEHDLRYKCKSDWEDHDDLSRSLNGIYATLETADWGVKQLFEELAYRHYKKREWGQMIRNKFRLRMEAPLETALHQLIESNDIGKKIFRIERMSVLKKILDLDLDLPINVNNLLFIINYFFINDKDLIKLTPNALIRKFDESLENKNRL